MEDIVVIRMLIVMVLVKMVMVKMMVVEDDSASSVKDGGVFLSFRRARVESSVVFEETT